MNSNNYQPDVRYTQIQHAMMDVLQNSRQHLLLLPEESHKCLGARQGMTSFWAPMAYISWSITWWSFSRERVSEGRMWNVPSEPPCNNRWFNISYNATIQFLITTNNKVRKMSNCQHYWLTADSRSKLTEIYVSWELETNSLWIVTTDLSLVMCGIDFLFHFGFSLV